MTTNTQATPTSGTAMPPYPAALSSGASTWQSPLARAGSIPLLRQEIHLGRLAGNDVVIQDAGVSRLHAAIRWTAAAYVIQDLGSANGTYVDDQPISGPLALQPGQRVRIGGTTFLFQALQVTGALGAPSTGGMAPTATAPAPAAGSDAGTVRMPAAAPAPAASGPGTVTLMPATAVSSAAHQLRQSAAERWLRAQLPKYYWRVLLIGLLAYVIAAQILDNTGNPNTVPLVALLSSAVVPVAFVVFCWEQGAFVDIPPLTLGIAFVSGSTIGLLLAAYLEPQVVTGSGVQAALLIGLCEESAKVAAAAWFLRDRRLRTELDGLVLGAAVGMGFAALETAGYGFSTFLQAFAAVMNAGGSGALAFQTGISTMIQELNLRMELAVFGHGVWTAIVCAAIWRERGAATFRLTSGVVLAFAIAVGLHTAWDSLPDANLALHLLVGVIGLVILRFFILDAIAQAKRGPAAAPASLADAMRAYFRFLSDRAPHVQATLQSFLGSVGTSAGGTGSSAVGAPAGASAQSDPAAHAPTVAVSGSAVAAPATGTPSPGQPATGAPDMAVARCAACGQPSSPVALFCGQCGARLTRQAT